MPSIEYEPRTQLTNLRKVLVVNLQCPMLHKPGVNCAIQFHNQNRGSNQRVRAALRDHLANPQRPGHGQLSEFFCFHIHCNDRERVHNTQEDINAHDRRHIETDAQQRGRNPNYEILCYACPICGLRLFGQPDVVVHYRDNHHPGDFLCAYQNCNHEPLQQQSAMVNHYDRAHMRRDRVERDAEGGPQRVPIGVQRGRLAGVQRAAQAGAQRGAQPAPRVAPQPAPQRGAQRGRAQRGRARWHN